MGKLKRQQYAILDSIVAEKGNEWLYDYLITQLFEGNQPSKIAADLGISYTVLKGWVLENCPEVFDVARKARADELEWKAMNVVMNADQETLGVAKLQSDHYMKVAAKLDRDTWGDGLGSVKGGDVSFKIVIGSTHPELEEKPDVIEGEFIEVKHSD
jgi:hypothetical protein